jgi:hypothetical protein
MIFILRRKRRITVLMNKGILVGIWGRVYRLQSSDGYLGKDGNSKPPFPTLPGLLRGRAVLNCLCTEILLA